MKVVLFANTDWYLYNFRRSLAQALRQSGYDVVLISPAGPYGDRLRDLGLRWEPVPMQRRSLNPIRELMLLWYLWRLFVRERPSLVHGFTIKCAVYGALAARLARVSARVSAVTGLGYVFTSRDWKARLLRPFVRTLLRVSLSGRKARLILQNGDDVEMFERAGLVAAARVRLIRGSGVDCTRFTVTTGRGGEERRLRVVLAARLLWDKGVAEFVQAARSLRTEQRDIQFFLAGEPDVDNPSAVPESTVRAWEAEGVLHWLGHVEDMPGLLSTVDVVVAPSYREGLPKSLIEAAACALPIIAADVPGCRDVVADGVDGLLVPARDAVALAAAIRRLDDDRTLMRQLGHAARVKVLRQFDERIVIRQTIEVYRELLPESANSLLGMPARGPDQKPSRPQPQIS
jgi:glycosyltransferase involved in cell wall biosynthesis